MRFQRLVQSILLLAVLSIDVAAQVRKDDARSIQERALRIEPYIVDSATRYGMDARLLRILCFIESRYRLDAVSPKGARGPMQFMPGTARRYGLQNPSDPRAAIDAGAHYLRDLLVRFRGRLDLAVAAYNAGEGTVESFQTGKRLVLANGKVINPRGRITGGVPPYLETRRYVETVLAFFEHDYIARFGSAPAIPRKRTPHSSARDFTLDTTVTNKAGSDSFFIEVR